MKVYVVMKNLEPLEVFTDKMKAHQWAEDIYGSKSDGISEKGIHVVAFNSVLSI